MEGILGMEQPVVFSMDSLFDPTMAQLLINAHRDYANLAYRDYQDYKEEEKEFNKLYGDFFSPIDSDNDAFYNATRGKLNETYNELVKQGIDPLRSVQGRAKMSKALRSIDYTGIAKLQQSAENAKKFMQARDALLAAGKYNKEMDEYFGKQLEGWDTTRDGIFDRISPMAYQSLSDSTQPWFDQMTLTNLGMTKDGKMIVGRDPEIAKQIIASNLNEGSYKGTPLEFHLNKIEQQVRAANPDMPEDQLQALIRNRQTQDIIDQNKELFTTNTTAEDPAYTRKENRKDQLTLLGARSGGGGGRSGGGRSYGGRSYGGGGSRIGSGGSIEHSWTEMVDSQDKGAVGRIKRVHGGGINVHVLQRLKSRLIAKDKNGNYKKDPNGRFMIKGGYVSAYNALTNLQTYIRTAGKKGKNFVNQFNASRKALAKLGWIDSQGQIKQTLKDNLLQQEYEFTNQQWRDKGSRSSDFYTKMKYANKYAEQQYAFPTGMNQTTAKDLFAGTSKGKAENGGIDFQFGDGNTHFTPIANLMMSGIVFKKSNTKGMASLAKRFDDWLKNNRITGITSGSSVSVSAPINGHRYFQGSVKIPYTAFVEFCNKAGYKSMADVKEAMRALGVVETNKQSSSTNANGGTSHSVRDWYVTVPVTKGLQVDPATDKQINDAHRNIQTKESNAELGALFEILGGDFYDMGAAYEIE